jgi:hypothetical protein
MNKKETKIKITDEEVELLETGSTNIDWLTFYKEIFK